MKKILLSSLFLLFLSFLFSVNSISASASELDKEYKTGAQIELYLKSNTSFDLSSLANAEYKSYEISDVEVADVENEKLVAKSAGFTYISFVYDDYVLHRNIIVHDGYETINEVKINNTKITSNNSSVVLYVGEEYSVLLNNDKEFSILDAKVILSSPYRDVPSDEFVRIDDEGKMRIVGVGKFYLTVKLPTNKEDSGIQILVYTTFEKTALESASLKYLEENNYQPICSEYGEKFITASELGLVESLTFSSISNLPNEKYKNIFPNLKKINIDLSQASSTSIGKVSIENEMFEYRFIGNSQKSYTMQLSVQSMNSIRITFENFRFSYSGTALNVTNASSAEIIFYGNCFVKSANNSKSTAMVGKKVNIVLADGASVEIRGGNGGTSGSGSIGLKADHVSIAAQVYSQNATINIYGGNGGNGSGNGQNGGNGNVGIEATSLSVKGAVSCKIYGGDGGSGTAGYSQTASLSTPGKSAAGVDGVNGTNGADGGNGGHGGKGASAIVVTTLQVTDVTLMHCVGGDGGDGANGGKGQNAGNGGNGGDTKKNTDAGDGGKGGNGGKGGKGGNGGNGATAIKIVNTNDLQTCYGLSMVHGYGGNAGNGGNGGNAGNGGNGGDDKNAGIFWTEGPVHGQGGSAGTAGSGGTCGTAGSKGSSFNISGITQTVANHPSKKTASNGSSGAAGKKGSEGDYGSVDK